MRQVFLDTETTGLDAANGDRLVEIGCIEMVDRRYTEGAAGRFHHYVNPQRSSHPDALRVHGITDAFLADKPLFADIAQAFLSFVRGAELIIHNATFDVGFIDAELARMRLPPLREHVWRITDSLLLAREQFPGKANSLDALCRRLEVDNSGRDLHGALLDAGLLAEVYIRMTRGQDSLVIDEQQASTGQGDLPQADLRSLALLLREPTALELEAHARMLAELDKASGGKAVWRVAQPQSQDAVGRVP